MDTRTDRSKVTVAPTEFKLVKYDPDEIADVAADLADRIGLANPIRIVVDETTPMAGMASTIDGTSSDALITIHVESGALEDTKRFTNFNRHHAEVSLGRMLLRARTTGCDRTSLRRPTTTRCRCVRRRRGTRRSTAGSNGSASRSTANAGCTTIATGSASPTTSMPTSTGCGRPKTSPGRRSTPMLTDSVRSGPDPKRTHLTDSVRSGPDPKRTDFASGWIAVVPDGVQRADGRPFPADAGNLAARRPMVVAAVRPPLQRIEVVRVGLDDLRHRCLAVAGRPCRDTDTRRHPPSIRRTPRDRAVRGCGPARRGRPRDR